MTDEDHKTLENVRKNLKNKEDSKLDQISRWGKTKQETILLIDDV